MQIPKNKTSAKLRNKLIYVDLIILDFIKKYPKVCYICLVDLCKHFLMRRTCFTLLFILGFVWFSFAQQTRSVLFVGNSYTAGNNLAGITSDIATSEGNELNYDVHTLGGQRFLNHAVNLDLAAKINAQDWDYVTLQGQSVEVALTGPIFDTEVAPFAAQLVDKIRLNNDCTEPVFFRTWGRENGFPSPDCNDFPWLCTYEGMDDELAQNYQILAEQNSTLISPVGAVWRYLRINHPSLDLYTGDGSHPTPTGSYAAAVTFYTLFFNTDPVNLNYNYTLSDADADSIKNAVSVVLYNAINDYDFTAYFSYETLDNTVSFSFSDIETESYLWSFGDGNSSNLQQPTNAYSNNGSYTVSLTINRCGRTHTFSRVIEISGLSTNEIEFDGIRVFPNPTSGQINISNAEQQVLNLDVYDSLGKRVKSIKNISETILLDNLRSGLYILKFYNKDTFNTMKLIIE